MDGSSVWSKQGEVNTYKPNNWENLRESNMAGQITYSLANNAYLAVGGVFDLRQNRWQLDGSLAKSDDFVQGLSNTASIFIPVGAAAGTISSKVIGNAQSTGTLGHAFFSKSIAYVNALNPNVSRVTLDLGYKKLLGGGAFKYGPRPDVGVLYKSGKVKIYEVLSKTDITKKVIGRNLRFMQKNGIKGTAKPIFGAQRLNGLFR